MRGRVLGVPLPLGAGPGLTGCGATAGGDRRGVGGDGGRRPAAPPAPSLGGPQEQGAQVRPVHARERRRHARPGARQGRQDRRSTSTGAEATKDEAAEQACKAVRSRGRRPGAAGDPRARRARCASSPSACASTASTSPTPSRRHACASTGKVGERPRLRGGPGEVPEESAEPVGRSDEPATSDERSPAVERAGRAPRSARRPPRRRSWSRAVRGRGGRRRRRLLDGGAAGRRRRRAAARHRARSTRQTLVDTQDARRRARLRPGDHGGQPAGPARSPGCPTAAPRSPAAGRSTGSTTSRCCCMYGTLPAYRDLQGRHEGPDVAAARTQPRRARLHAASPWTTSTPAATADAVKRVAGRPRARPRPAWSSSAGSCSPPARSGWTSLEGRGRPAGRARPGGAHRTPAPPRSSPSSWTRPTSGWPRRAPRSTVTLPDGEDRDREGHRGRHGDRAGRGQDGEPDTKVEALVAISATPKATARPRPGRGGRDLHRGAARERADRAGRGAARAAEGGYGVEVVEGGTHPLRRGEDRAVRRRPGRDHRRRASPRA